MFSFSKLISKINPLIFDLEESGRLDIYSLNYILKFDDKNSRTSFFSSISFYLLIDNYDNKLSISFDIIGNNHETNEYVVLKHNIKNLYGISKIITSKHDPECISYKIGQIIQPAVDYSTMSIDDILSYIKKEISYAKDEAIMFISKNNILHEDEDSTINNLFISLNDIFLNKFSIENLRIEQPNFYKAEIIHNNLFINNIAHTNSGKKVKTLKF